MIDKMRALSADTQRAHESGGLHRQSVSTSRPCSTIARVSRGARSSPLLSPALQGGLILRSGGHLSFAHDRVSRRLDTP